MFIYIIILSGKNEHYYDRHGDYLDKKCKSQCIKVSNCEKYDYDVSKGSCYLYDKKNKYIYPHSDNFLYPYYDDYLYKYSWWLFKK